MKHALQEVLEGPTFAPFFVCGRRDPDGKTIALWAKNRDGHLAMEATATLG